MTSEPLVHAYSSALLLLTMQQARGRRKFKTHYLTWQSFLKGRRDLFSSHFHILETSPSLTRSFKYITAAITLLSNF